MRRMIEDGMQLATSADDFYAFASAEGYREFHKPGGEADRLWREAYDW